MQERLSKIEVSVAVLSGMIVLIATLTGPRLSHGVSRDTRAVAHARQDRQISELETALQGAREESRTLQTQLAEAGVQLEELRSELAALKQERETLSTQLAASTDNVRELEKQLETASQEAAKLKPSVSVQGVTKERDEAIARAEKAEERIRELTLQLHQAGLWR